MADHNHGAGEASGNLDVWDKVIALCSALIGVAPPGLTAFGFHPLSLYNPPIYEHLEFFLIFPIAVAAYTSWSVMKNPGSMRPIFWTCIFLGLVTLFVYLAFPEPYLLIRNIDIHALNWILSYCFAAMAVALFAGFLIALKKA